MTTNLHTAWARLFVNALASSGVRDVVVSPGSRSTPLALAAAQAPGLRVHVHVDERVAAFFALGQARATAAPTALFCTSGTAGAHWIPAAIEASLTGVPLVCVTADRPWEAYDCASPQTVDQLDLLGRHARHRAELGVPDASIASLRAVGRIASQATHRSRWPLPGAVHINARFRKPLEPVVVPGSEPWEPLVQDLLARGPTRSYAPALAPSPEAVRALVEALRGAREVWIVGGPTLTHAPESVAALRDVVHALCRATGASLLAEATSNLRYDAPPGVASAPLFDALLRSPSLVARARPDVVIELGLPPTSPSYAAYVAERSDLARFVVAPQGWPDPHNNATAVINADAVSLLRAVLAALPAEPARPPGPLALAQRAAASVVDAEVRGDIFHEGQIADTLVSALPAGAVLCVGNSLPVRDLDAFSWRGRADVRVTHQRGASGIDGIIAGAAGARTVTPRDRLVVAYLGDISAVHDVGGLNAARIAEGPLGVLVVNNGGGRIFEQLPLGRQSAAGTADGERFERLFTTPQSVSFEHAALAFGVRYARVASRDELERALRECADCAEPTLIEAVVDPATGRACRDRTLSAVLRSIA